ncbi:ATP/GTP-binding protein [Rathayibacter sp. AY2B7]|uniref:TRAFAC clade GTPase domain-containing protein n=1 Tax=Rathayibacter sp. AY2B7 TaxID=2080571 RepID=UPI000CE8281F|nr:ATP/GTP-binding protein [Rathayibacter sp. AY2B7]PPG63120.1 ATP/GTP-binding protein [Rathayibacter sp. AY2B7]
MVSKRIAREQQIAVFGESGSGKTVLISSFYGLAMEGLLSGADRFDLLANDAADGRRLHQNYLGMKNSAVLPPATRFSKTSYSFAIRPKRGAHPPKAGTAEELRLVWHDYPGEWFEQEPDGPTEAKRRIDTFRALIGSDVAMILVDAQKLLDNAGEEERYLKALLTGFSQTLLQQRDDVLEDGKPFAVFPRVWTIALSKADLLPDMDVVRFRDLVVEKAGTEINKLQGVLREFVEAPEALSVGDDFVRLSSARFEPEKIEISKRIGVDLILPIAAMLPFSRYIRWAAAMKGGGAVAERLLAFAVPIAALVGKLKLPAPLARLGGPIAAFAGFVGPGLGAAAAEFAGKKVRGLHDDARARHDFLAETLTAFELDLDRGVDEKVLLRSRE